MAIEELKDQAVEAVSGGTNTTDWTGAHWQPTSIPMGTTFVQYGYLWYRIKNGDSLGQIAKTFSTTTAQLQINNPKTITNINNIYAGDAIIIRRA